MASHLRCDAFQGHERALELTEQVAVDFKEIALFLRGQDTWGELMQLAAAHTDMLQGPCGLQLSLVAWAT